MSRISREEVEHVAMLARMELTGEELELYTRQLGDILDHFAQLNQLDQEIQDKGVEPTAHIIPLETAFREDEVIPSPDPEPALALAPARDGTSIVVPRIIE